MKINLHRMLIPAIFLLPQLVFAQWSLVRFDEYNFFNKAEATSATSAIVTGIDGMGTGSFILRTNNGGTTWDSISINSGISYSLAELNFTDINSGYAGGIKNNYQVLLKTVDNGTTWTEVTPDPASVNGIIAISFTDPLNGFSSDGFNLYRTTDGGLSWTTTVLNYVLTDLRFTDMDHGYACGSSGTDAVVIKTIDGGITWTTVFNAFFPFFTASSMQKADVVTPDVVYSSGQYTDRLYKTVDGGISWDTIQIPLIYSIQDFDFINATEGHLLTSMGEIFGTSDGGATWTLEYAVASGAYGPLVYLVSISFWESTGYVCGSNGLIKKYETPTGIVTIDNDTFSLFPNPVNSKGALQINNLNENDLIEIYNTTGQKVYSRSAISGSMKVNCDFNAGLYTVVINGEKERNIKKLLVVD